jgi:hypothetical protein
MLPRLNRASFAAVLMIPALPIYAQIAGPFAGMAGPWAGGGVVALATGAKERLRCRAAYKVGGGGRTLQLSIRCVSDSYNFHLTGSVVEPDGTISGRLNESGHSVAGNVSGRASGGTIQAVASGDSFSAGITLVTHGHRQSVTIRPSAGTDVTTVSVTLGKK